MFKETNWFKTNFDKQNYIENFQLSKTVLKEYVSYLSSLNVVNNSVFSYNIFFPIKDIAIEEKNIVRSLFQPTREIIEYLNGLFIQLGVTPHNYIVIHIRSGDIYLNNETKIFNSVYLNIMKNEVMKVILDNKNNNKNVLLIADNNEIKYLLKQEFSGLKVIFKEITHIGEGTKLTRDKIFNTLVDFYLMSYSSYIYSFTSYPHGSGFSYWCSIMYNIPYKCKYINIK